MILRRAEPRRLGDEEAIAAGFLLKERWFSSLR